MKKYISFDDNLRMAYFHCPNLRSVSVGIYVNTGSNNETAELNGISHALEHMMFKGTKRSTAIEISQKGDLLGGRVNAATSGYYTLFYGTVLDYLDEQLFDYLSEITTESVFPAEEWERERKVILEEISMCEDDYEDLAFDELMLKSYPDQSIGRPVLGTRETVSSFTIDDIRSYYTARYISGNIVISVAGNITFDRAKALAEKYFVGRFPYSAKLNAFVERPFDLVPMQTKTFKDSSQANLVIGFPCCDMYDEVNYYRLSCLSSLLGGSMSSRLFVNLREKKGLCYNVYTFTTYMRANGLYSIYVGTNAKQIVQSIHAIRETLTEMLQGGVSKTEFDCAQALRNTNYTLSFENSTNIMRAMGKYALNFDDMFDLDKELARNNEVTAEDALEALAALDMTKAQISYVGEKIDTDLLEVFGGK